MLTHVILASGARESHLRTTQIYVASGRAGQTEFPIGRTVLGVPNSSPRRPQEPPRSKVTPGVIWESPGASPDAPHVAYVKRSGTDGPSQVPIATLWWDSGWPKRLPGRPDVPWRLQDVLWTGQSVVLSVHFRNDDRCPCTCSVPSGSSSAISTSSRAWGW